MAKHILSYTKINNDLYKLIVYEGDTKDVYRVNVNGEKIKIHHLLQQDEQTLIELPISLLSEIGMDITSLLTFEPWGEENDYVSS